MTRASEPDAVPPVLRLRDLHVTFATPGGSVHAVRGVDLDVRRGERLALVGESGCGKSTTMLAVMGLLPPSATIGGEVIVDGEPMRVDDESRTRERRWLDVAMVFQGAMSSLNPVLSISRQIVEPMRIHETAPSVAMARRRAAELLELVGMPAKRADAYPHELSGGMRQRASIAMALACDPKLLIADEPTTALDTIVQAQIFELLVRLCDETGIALLLVTHDLPVVMQVCDRAGVMYAGRIAEMGAVEQLYERPSHPYTRQLLQATPDLVGTEPIQPIPGAPPPLDRPLTQCAFRDRCDVAFEPCGMAPPLLAVDHDGQIAACWHVDPDHHSAQESL